MFGQSSINWCEEDYAVCNFIAEFWNSITGIFLCSSSIYCYYKNKQDNIHVLTYSNILLFFVGVGTALFHGTLIYIWQLLDEIPMMLIVIEYTRILSTLTLASKVKLIRINYRFMYKLIPVMILSYYIHPTLQIITFQGSLVLFTGFLLYSCNKINCSLNKQFYNAYKFEYIENAKRRSFSFNPNAIDKSNSHSEFKKYSKLRTLMKNYNKKGLFLLFFSLLIWNIDNHYCQHFIHLHAIWHFTTSLGMFYCNEIIKIYLKLEKQLYVK